MILFSKLFPKPSYLSLSVAMLVCLILLLCLSLKIVVVQGVIFTASSVFIAITAACYFTVLRKCNFTEPIAIGALSLFYRPLLFNECIYN